MANVGVLDIDLRLMTAKFEAGMQKARGNLATFGTQLGNAMAVASGAVTAGLTAMKAGTVAATIKTLELAGSLSAASAAFNVSSQAIQSWDAAAQSAGLEAGKVTDIFKDVSDKIGDLSTTGGGEAKDLFDELNLKVKEFVGLRPDEALLKVGAALDKSGLSKSQKIFLLEGLADDASRLLPVLEDNAKNLKELAEYSSRVGAILSPGQLDTLGKANNELTRIKTAMIGLSNEAGVAGAEFINAFGSDISEAIAGATNWAVMLESELGNVSGVWEESLAQMSTTQADYLASSVSDWGGLLDYWRIGFTYLPVWSQAAFEAVHSYGEAFGARFSALNYQLRAGWQVMFASMAKIAGAVFGKIADMAGGMASAVLGKIAAPLDAAASALGNIPGLDSLASDINAAAGAMRNMQASAAGAGDSVRAKFGEWADGYMAVAEASANASRIASAQAQAASLNAQYVLAQASATQVQAEQQRVLNNEFNAASKQFERLNTQYDVAAAGAAKADAANAKLGKGAIDAANKAASATKKAAEQQLSAPWLKGSQAFRSEIDAAAKRFNVDANLVQAVIQQETGWMKNAAAQLKAVSPAGAKGIMQVMPGTAAMVAKEIGMTNYNLFSAADNINLGTAYLSQQLTKYNGDIEKVAAAYNAGPGAVDKYAGIPPYKETQVYVQKVLGYYKDLTAGVDTSGESQIKAIMKVEEERQKAAQELQDAQDKELAGLKDQQAQILLSGEAYYAATLDAKGFSDSVIKQAEALHYANTLMGEQKAIADELAKAGTSTVGSYEIDLKAKGLNKSDISGLVGKKMQVELANLQKQTAAMRAEATMTDKAFREWQLTTETGLTPAMAQLQAQSEQDAQRMMDLHNAAKSAFDGIGDAILDTVMTGKANWGDLIQSMIREAIKLKVIKPWLDSMMSGGSSTGGAGGIFSSIGKLFGFANGGTFDVGGAGGVDSQVVAFRATPGERVIVQTPDQQAGEGVTISMPISIDARGADSGAVERIQSAIASMESRIYRNIPSVVRQAQIRNRVSPSI